MGFQEKFKRTERINGKEKTLTGVWKRKKRRKGGKAEKREKEVDQRKNRRGKEGFKQQEKRK